MPGFAVGRDRVTGARVHLKTAASLEAVAAIDREVRVAARVSHPLLRALIDHGEVGGHRAAVFEWVEGAALSGDADAERIAREVLRGLLALHAAGFVMAISSRTTCSSAPEARA